MGMAEALSWQDGDAGSGTAPAAAADPVMEVNGENTFVPQSAQGAQLQPGCLHSLTVSGFPGDVEVPTLPAGDGHVSRSRRAAGWLWAFPAWCGAVTRSGA